MDSNITLTVESCNASPNPLFSSTSSDLNILEPTGTEPSTGPIINICDDVQDDYETEVRRRAWNLVKRKVENRLKDVELDNETRAQLEKELIEDLEDTIQDKLSEYRSSKTLEEMNNNGARSQSS